MHYELLLLIIFLLKKYFQGDYRPLLCYYRISIDSGGIDLLQFKFQPEMNYSKIELPCIRGLFKKYRHKCYYGLSRHDNALNNK